ncbi:hypothetical protein [Texcoconibacillus texcoconensis]|uniref:DNA-directed RNA polymerase subunit M/transcription elongation factor TFIIS n=1 Tax=Texcoconibacillus texcoconensis TaxID=1095777 RepID=A0A840QM19_9BACI|nr:hypothetical protein [Texcoconibacillus texcoconensis]MBB5172422.1 DNA-directed RNA polymerase subunit M/transcription elongation factor TFIIS [Texcoconibacillus texcoconensis]
MGKKIEETKCTCQACGNVWYYGKDEVQKNFGEKLQNLGSDMSNTGKDMMCCTGCLPALFIPEKQKNNNITDLDTCPNCRSKAVTKEKVVHDV